jgi:O-antigen/teichoic acid export membrane protein
VSVLKRNVVANALGQSVGVLSGVLLMPLYARHLGHEAFGLVGFFLSLQAVTAIFDLGLGAAANREIGRLSIQAEPRVGREVVRTLEWLYLALGLLLASLLALASGWIAVHWIRAEHLPPEVVRYCVLLSAATIGIRLLASLYWGVMRGLERQVQLNLFYAGIVVVQTAGLAAILVGLHPSVQTFLACQLGFAMLEIASLRQLVWHACAQVFRDAAAFRIEVLRRVWRFALSVNAISLFAAGIKQVDKLVISKLLPIGVLGFYSAAALAANGLGKIAVPFQAALFPRFSKLFAQQKHAELSRVFHHSVRVLSCLTCAVAAGFVFFAHDILYVWMGSLEAADTAARPMAVLSAAMMLNGVMAPVFSMILATGYTRISLAMNAVGFVVLIPLTLFLVSRQGLTGAACAWLGYNLAYYGTVPAMLARRWGGLGLSRFYLQDSLPFVLTSLVVCGAGSWFAHDAPPLVRLAMAFLAVGLSVAAAVALSAPLRQWVVATLRPARA